MTKFDIEWNEVGYIKELRKTDEEDIKYVMYYKNDYGVTLGVFFKYNLFESCEELHKFYCPEDTAYIDIMPEQYIMFLKFREIDDKIYNLFFTQKADWVLMNEYRDFKIISVNGKLKLIEGKISDEEVDTIEKKYIMSKLVNN